jgi:hypothetical protein
LSIPQRGETATAVAPPHPGQTNAAPRQTAPACRPLRKAGWRAWPSNQDLPCPINNDPCKRVRSFRSANQPRATRLHARPLLAGLLLFRLARRRRSQPPSLPRPCQLQYPLTSPGPPVLPRRARILALLCLPRSPPRPRAPRRLPQEALGVVRPNPSRPSKSARTPPPLGVSRAPPPAPVVLPVASLFSAATPFRGAPRRLQESRGRLPCCPQVRMSQVRPAGRGLNCSWRGAPSPAAAGNEKGAVGPVLRGGGGPGIWAGRPGPCDAREGGGGAGPATGGGPSGASSGLACASGPAAVPPRLRSAAESGAE